MNIKEKTHAKTSKMFTTLLVNLFTYLAPLPSSNKPVAIGTNPIVIELAINSNKISGIDSVVIKASEIEELP